jgi:16S rRNA (guanine527-N7)-methyltransferase
MQGGYLVCWKGRRDPEEEAEMERAAERLAIEPVEIAAVGPYAGSLHRHIHLLRKNGRTPEGLPRRPGMAKKRPFGAEPPQSKGSKSANQ